MFLEIALGLAIVVGVAFSWHAYTRPERVLERFMRSLHMPDYLLEDYRDPVGRLTLVGDELTLRYLQGLAAVRDFLWVIDDNETWAGTCARLTQMGLDAASADRLEAMHDDVFFGLHRAAIDHDKLDRFCDLEERIVGLIADLRLLQKLERAFLGAAS